MEQQSDGPQRANRPSLLSIKMARSFERAKITSQVILRLPSSLLEALGVTRNPGPTDQRVQLEAERVVAVEDRVLIGDVVHANHDAGIPRSFKHVGQVVMQEGVNLRNTAGRRISPAHVVQRAEVNRIEVRVERRGLTLARNEVAVQSHGVTAERPGSVEVDAVFRNAATANDVHLRTKQLVGSVVLEHGAGLQAALEVASATQGQTVVDPQVDT